MRIFAPFESGIAYNRVNLSWLWPPPCDLYGQLRRRLGRRVRVRTGCATLCGRLMSVAHDHIVLRRRGRSVLIRIAAISWVRPQLKAVRRKRRRRRRTRSGCCRFC